MSKCEIEVLNKIKKWSRWKEQKIDYWRKDGDYIAKEIILWQRKLKNNGKEKKLAKQD